MVDEGGNPITILQQVIPNIIPYVSRNAINQANQQSSGKSAKNEHSTVVELPDSIVCNEVESSLHSIVHSN